MQNNKQTIGFWTVYIFLCCYFMQLFNFPNRFTISLGGSICLILLIKQRKFRQDIGAGLLILTIASYFIIQYGSRAFTMSLPYVGVLIYVLANYLACETASNDKSELIFLSLIFMLVLGYSLHGIFNSYLFLDGQLEPGNPRYWMDIWEQDYLPGTWQVVFFLPALAIVFPALVYFKQRKLSYILTIFLSVFFLYISWISNSRMSIFVFPLVFCAQIVLYVILEWEKVKAFLCRRKKLVVAASVIGLLLATFLVSTDNPLKMALIEKLGRDGGIFGSDRLVAQRNALKQLFLYPMGGRKMEFGPINYAHNVWLDMANVSGLIPFFAFTAYTLWTIYELICWLMKKGVSTERKLVAAGIYGAFFLFYSMERGLEGSMHYMTPWFFLNGMVHGELTMLKNSVKK